MILKKFREKLTSGLLDAITANQATVECSVALRVIKQAICNGALTLPLEADDEQDQAKILAVISAMEGAITAAFTTESAIKIQKANQPKALKSGR